ncbi:hypothetical protein HK104_010576 [Borealophlyctis nickersoniae]|nr:hypothetical protein HK104_010576 [Borealophlyctis nickersoniae]
MRGLTKALGLAANGGHIDAVKLLMSDREDGGFHHFLVEGYPLCSAIGLALDGRHDNIVQFLLPFVETSDFHSVFRDVVCHENVAILRSMLELMENGGLSPYEGQEMLDDALCIACRMGNVEIMDILHEAGAALDADNGRPMFEAARDDCIKVLDYLLKHGISANAKLPLTFCSSLNAVQLLLSHGANPNVIGRTFWGELTSPLGRAAHMSNPASVKALLDAGADPRAEDDHALCCAIQVPGSCRPGADLACVDLILGTFPPNTSIPDNAWGAAAEKGNVDIFNRFLALDPPTPPRAGAHIAALHMAAEKGHDEILQALRDAGVEAVDGRRRRKRR